MRWPVIGLVAVIVIGTGTAYAVAGTNPAARYRTVAATRTDVQQTLSTSGVVDAADRADLAFATSGTVAALKVVLGQEVTTGQVVATLDTGSLDAALTQAQASVAKAVAQLASDRAAQSSAVSNAVSSTPSSGTGSSGTKPSGSSGTGSSGTGSTGTSAATLAALKGLQDKVIAAQTAASAAIAAAKSALAAQTSACATAFTPTPTASPTDAPTTGPDPADAACTTALAAVQAAQDAVSKAQDDLAHALDALAGALTKALGSSSGHGSTPASSARSVATPSTTGATSNNGSASSPSASSGGTVTAARLASDQAQIYQAQAALITAQQNRAQAVVRSTRPGRVVALDSAVGDTVAAGHTVATVVGGNAVTIGGTVPETQIGSVKLGQVVQVSVPGISKTTTGQVTQIGLVADTSTGTTSYPVTVTVEDPTISLPTGSNAMLQIVVATAHDVVTVPTSAVIRNGTTGTVQTWDGKTLGVKHVTLGAVGARRVVIASGLTAGTEVVLAAMDQPIKGASSTLNNRGNFPTFSFRGAGGSGGSGGFRAPSTSSKPGG